MKKKLLILGVVLALLAALVMPTPVLANGTTEVGGTLEVPTITSIDVVSGVQGNSYTIVFTGTFFTGATAVSFGALITDDGYVVDSATQITADIIIGAAAGTGLRDVSVTAAGGTATLTEGFTVVASTFSVTAPAGFSLGIMTRATNTLQGPDGTVTTNAQNWQVNATGSASNSGYMYNGTASPTAEFQIGEDGAAWTGASGTLTYDQTDGTPFNFWGQQVIDGDDPAGTYSITITFTGSAQ